MKTTSVLTVFGASKTSNTKQSNKKNHKKAIFGTSALLLTAGGITAAHILPRKKVPNKYILELANALSKELNKTVKPSDLESVMTKEEFLRIIPRLREENFIASEENIKKGFFIADLHSHSHRSDGKISVKELLNQAANYGNELNKKNGNKFIFALTDHDGIEGVKEALKLIAQEPEKYKNIKFIPAGELSFVETCSRESNRFKLYNSDVQMPEMLIYNINPFSENTKIFFSELYAKRKMQVEKMIYKANAENKGYNFSLEEYQTLLDRTKGKYYLLNQHWNIHDYLQLKTRLVDMAREQKRDEKQFFEEIISNLPENKRTPGELAKYLKNKNFQTSTPEIYDRITKISKEFFPRSENGRAISDYDNSFDDIANYAIKENAHLAFAHPGFTLQNFTKDETYAKIRSYILRSKGMLRFCEKYHQAYPIGKGIDSTELNEYNKYLDEFNLFNIGGRDNHSDKFI